LTTPKKGWSSLTLGRKGGVGGGAKSGQKNSGKKNKIRRRDEVGPRVLKTIRVSGFSGVPGCGKRGWLWGGGEGKHGRNLYERKPLMICPDGQTQPGIQILKRVPGVKGGKKKETSEKGGVVKKTVLLKGKRYSPKQILDGGQLRQGRVK